MNEIYDTLNKEWKNTCRVLLLREIGEMKEYEGWLRENLEPVESVKSSLSGKEILAVGDYPKDAKFISFDEVDQGKKFAPLSINDVKDIDSIVRAVGERAVYCGNIVLGNSSQIEASTGIEDSHFVLGSHTFHKSQYVAYCTLGREIRAFFGSSFVGESSFVIKSENVWRTARCFCSSWIYESADAYYSHGLNGCSDCMFCFGIRGARNCIGNVQLEKDKYAELKKKLLGEIAAELTARKRLAFVTELAPKKRSKPHFPPTSEKDKERDFGAIEAAFSKTCELILGKGAGSILPLEKYLLRNVRGSSAHPSALSGKPVYAGGTQLDLERVKTGRLATFYELLEFSKVRDAPAGIKLDSIGFSNVQNLIEPIAYFATEEEVQSNNIIECPTAHHASDCFRCNRTYRAKYCALSFWPRDSEYMFGCDSTRNSSFCIKCYNSYKLSRCFEADTSQNCTGCYFIHNCENVHDSMFCFNVKNLRYAIGNAQVGREKFLEAKAALQKYILERLEKEKKLELDIYNIGILKSKN